MTSTELKASTYKDVRPLPNVFQRLRAPDPAPHRPPFSTNPANSLILLLPSTPKRFCSLLQSQLSQVQWLFMTPALAAPTLPTIRLVFRKFWPQHLRKAFITAVIYFNIHGYVLMNKYAEFLLPPFKETVPEFPS